MEIPILRKWTQDKRKMVRGPDAGGTSFFRAAGAYKQNCRISIPPLTFSYFLGPSQRKKLLKPT